MADGAQTERTPSSTGKGNTQLGKFVTSNTKFKKDAAAADGRLRASYATTTTQKAK